MRTILIRAGTDQNDDDDDDDDNDDKVDEDDDDFEKLPADIVGQEG